MNEIVEYLKTVESATIEDIYQNCGRRYYHNAHKYISEIMSRLVKQGRVIRVKNGVFKAANRTIVQQDILEM
jgi:predicted transcriptional regulator